VRNIAVVSFGSFSIDEQDHWIPCDFPEMRVLPLITHFETALKSSGIKRSMHGVNWTEIDLGTDNNDLTYAAYVASLSLSTSAGFPSTRCQPESH
jgi:hypothetical protein